MEHRHLKKMPGKEFSRAAIEDILARGSVDDWRRLYEAIQKDRKHLENLKVILANTYHYGTTAFWKEMVRGIEADAPPKD